jgi:hypothetical protein
MHMHVIGIPVQLRTPGSDIQIGLVSSHLSPVASHRLSPLATVRSYLSLTDVSLLFLGFVDAGSSNDDNDDDWKLAFLSSRVFGDAEVARYMFLFVSRIAFVT